MKYYVIINGNSSLDIQGLAIESLPNISKPLIRTTREEIDGRDGDIIAKLGYSAYDKTLNIGLWGNYDINEVIAYFNQEGVITFSNEPDKYYKFHILNRIDFVNQLEKFKKASITIHCQPFKYKEQEAKVIEEEEHTTSGTSFNLSDTLEAPLEIDLKGNTSQTGTPTPSSPIPVNVVSGDNDIVVCGKNLFNASIQSGTYGSATYSVASDGLITQSASDGSAWNISQGRIFYLPAGTYTISIDVKSGAKQYMQLHDIVNDTDVAISSSNSRTFTLTQTTALGFKTYGSGGTYPVSYYVMINKGETATTYEAYNGTTYNIDLPEGMELNKIGTYQDYIYKENDKWYLHKETWKTILGVNNVLFDNRYSSSSSGKYYFGLSSTIDMVKPPNNTTLPVVLCDKLIKKTSTNLYNAIEGIGLNDGATRILVYADAISQMSLNDANAWLSSNNLIIYGALATPTNTEITYTPLIEQLNTLEQAQSKEGTTNINQVNNDLPFIIDLTYYTGDTSITITNDGNIYSKPLLELKGTGNINIYLNGIQVFVVSLNNEIIYIDTDKMEAYYQGTLKNRQVVGDYNNFKLQSGNNTIQVDGGYVEYLKIINYSRWV